MMGLVQPIRKLEQSLSWATKFTNAWCYHVYISLTKPPLEILHYTFNNKGKTYKYM